MGLKLNEDQVDDIMDVVQAVWMVDVNQIDKDTGELSGVWAATQQLLLKAMEKKKSTSRNNPLVWWMSILVRSALSGEVDFISRGRFNQNPLPIDVDIKGRVEAVIHYSKVLALNSVFLSWDVKREWLREVQQDLDSVDNVWINGQKGGRPASSMDKRSCSSEAWRSALAHIRTGIQEYVGGKARTAMYRIRMLEDDVASSRGG